MPEFLPSSFKEFPGPNLWLVVYVIALVLLVVTLFFLGIKGI